MIVTMTFQDEPGGGVTTTISFSEDIEKDGDKKATPAMMEALKCVQVIGEDNVIGDIQ